ncbi:glycosyltransferase [Nitriliruptor alkaliphilus]|uniref:glycosyltransferase n=1 Tax=Nitriliruptor alkaliphilus TaxID=427918 RepID=UPI00069612CC|nr:glycosyltransferase family A protein [Nitriliruptor alkaliphilus]
MDISVVIPCFDAAPVVGQQLTALADQVDAPPFEVVVVDDGSGDATSDIVRGHAARLAELRIIRLDHSGGVANARNVGVEHATGSRVLFCDADDVVAPAWVAALSSALDEHPLVAGPLEYGQLNPASLAAVAAGRQTHGLQLGDPPFLPFAGGGNLGARREVLEAIGGFDTSLPALEDTDLCFRAQLAGFALAFEPAAVVHVRLRGSLLSSYRQGWSWGMGTACLHRRFRASGMQPPNRWRHLLGWFAALPRLSTVRSREHLAIWLFVHGWRVGRLRFGLEHRLRGP